MANHESGSVRIIAGRWRRRHLRVFSKPGLRPTPDRVRETLFNWLADELPGARCLDLFAGTGALGFEAASRGAEKVVLIERDAQLAGNLREQAAVLDASMVEIECKDALAWLREPAEAFDIIFIDPPYGSIALPNLLETLQQSARLKPTSIVYVETSADDGHAVFPDTWSVLRDKRAGGVRYYLGAPSE